MTRFIIGLVYYEIFYLLVSLNKLKKKTAITRSRVEILTEFKLIVDSMEQPRERPCDNEEQKEYFSGKKKQHTFKNEFITLPAM